MKIEGMIPPHINASRRKREIKGSFKVSLSSTSETQENKQAFESSSVQGPAELMGLQEIMNSCLSVNERVHHGWELLKGLETLQMRLLEGNLDENTLQALEKELAVVHIQENDSLSETIKEIRQRVAIELAKKQTPL